MAVLLGLVSGGTLGYRLLEGWNWSDSLYMTLVVLTTVGFNEVVNPYQLSGNRIAQLMIAPNLASFLGSTLDLDHFTMREMAVPPAYVGRSIEQFGQDSGALVVAIWRGNQDTLLESDSLLLAGTADEVARAGR